MSEKEASASKRPAKKAAAVTEAAKPKKTATAKAAGTGKAMAAKPVAKVAAAVAEPAKPKKAAAPKAAATGTRKKAAAASTLVEKPSAPSAEERQRWIATAAYHRAEKRGFAPGYEMQDWLDAEAEISALIGKA